MKENLVELNDEETQSIENGDGINDGIYSPSYEDQFIEDLECPLSGIFDGIRYLHYLVDKNIKAGKDLRTIENQITILIGNDSYKNILELIRLQKSWLERDIEEQWEEYNELDQSSANNTVKNNIKDKIK